MHCTVPNATRKIDVSILTRIVTLFLGYLFCVSFAFAQGNEVKIRVRVKDVVPTQAKLCYHMLGEDIEVYEAQGDTTGVYTFSLPELKSGFYRFYFGERAWILPLLLLDPTDTVEILTTALDPLVQAKVVGAPEAQIYLTARVAKERYTDALWGIEFLEKYNLEETAELKKKINKKYRAEIEELRKNTSDNLLQAMLDFFCKPLESSAFDEWWRHDIFETSMVTFVPEFTDYLYSYFTSLKDTSLSYWEQVARYGESIQQLAKLKREESNDLMLRYVLTATFQDGVYDVLLDTIAEAGFGTTLTSDYKRPETRETERLAKMKVTDIEGQKQWLISRKEPYTLLIVWSVACEHCRALMPKLWAVYEALGTKKVAVRTIAVDDNTPQHRAYIRSQAWKWINIIEKDDGQSALLEALNADGTPELFLLDANGHLLARPENASQLRLELQNRIKN